MQVKRLLTITVAVGALSVLLASCGQQNPHTAADTTTQSVIAAPPPVPADFDPCNTVTFAAIQTVIGTKPTIAANDRTGSVSEGWATCSYHRADASAGPTFTVRMAKLPSGPQAANRQREIIGGVTGAAAVPHDPDSAYVWTQGDTLYLQYARGWWLTRRTVEGATDAQTKARLIAAPRWP